MIVLYWNARGIGNSDTRNVLKNLFMSHKLMIIFIVEPMIKFTQVPHSFGKVWVLLSISTAEVTVAPIN